jgi:predicted nuclease of predicted toxin-antitoxin system
MKLLLDQNLSPRLVDRLIEKLLRENFDSIQAIEEDETVGVLELL